MIEGVDIKVLEEICRENPEIAIKEYFNYVRSKEVIKNNIDLLFCGEGTVNSQNQVTIPSDLMDLFKKRQEKDESEDCILYCQINKKDKNVILFDDIQPIIKIDPYVLENKGNKLISLLHITNDSRIILPREIFKQIKGKKVYALFKGKIDSVDVSPIYKTNLLQ